MKTLLWILAIAGTAGPCLLAAIYLCTHISGYREIGRMPLPPGVSGSTHVSAVGINGPGFSWELTTSPWPAVLVLSGAVLFLTGLFFLVPKQPQTGPPTAPDLSRTANVE
jgi:hypothetical protein